MFENTRIRISTLVPDGDSPSRYIHIDREDLSNRTQELEPHEEEGIDREFAMQLYLQYARDYDFNEFYMGLADEMEHAATIGYDSETLAKIVVDHLKEHPNYYTRLHKAFGSVFSQWHKSRYIISDITQNDIADQTIYHTDLHQWTDENLPRLRQKDKPMEMHNYADQNGNAHFVFLQGKIYWGKSLEDILSNQLMHQSDLYSAPLLSGTMNVNTEEIAYDDNSELNDPNLKKTFLFQLKKEFGPPDPWVNDDIDHSAEEIYDVKMH